MKRPSILQASLAAALSLAGCKWSPDDPGDKTDPNSDIKNALGALPDVQVLDWTADGVPLYMVGEMATVGVMDTDDLKASEAVMRPQMPAVLAPMRLVNEDLVVRSMTVDDDGNRFVRFAQTHNGLDVIGGDLVVQVSSKGSIASVNGTARGDISEELGASPISQSSAIGIVTSDYRFVGMSAASPRLVYIQLQDGTFRKAYETVVTGARGLDPVRDAVYVDLDTGTIVADHPQIHFAESRKVYTANNTTTTPGTLKRSEGGAATGDSAIDGAYDGTGDTWEMYHNRFNRDSYDNAGATLISTVHYDVNYCNAFWDGTQMTYGDGDPSQGCSNLAQSIDVTAHELTHAVTERTSGLVYSGESGGMNESMSDTLGGSQTEAFVNGGKNGTLVENAGTFLVGETVLPPFLRNQCDPFADGVSADVWSSSVGSLDPHYSSGPPNLVGCLMAHGGMHPRGKTTVMVPAIGMDKMERIWYKANTEILTSNATYATFHTAAVQAAVQLGYDQATQDAVDCAFAAIATPGATCAGGGGGGGGGGGDTVLMNGVAATGQSGALGAQSFYKITVPAGQTSLVFTLSGGTGDADMYTKFGAHPTLTTYDCRPYISGNGETCSVTNPAAGDYYVMLNGYAAYAGVSLKATFTAGGGGGGGCTGSGDTCLSDGVPVTGIAGAKSSKTYFRAQPGAGKTLTVTISGGTGDADLYVRQGARPTTATFACRPYITGNNETCTLTATKAGDYDIMLRGYAAYSGVTLKASW